MDYHGSPLRSERTMNTDKTISWTRQVRRFYQVIVVAACILFPGVVRAQSAPAGSLRGRIEDFAERAVTVALGAPDSQLAAGTIAVFAELTTLEVATAPIGTSTGGFTFTFDPQLGTFKRSTQSFGPAFASRSVTTGKGKLSIGANWLHAGYDSINGSNLNNGDFLVVRNGQSGLPFPVPGRAPVKINDTSDTVVGQVTYGLTDNLDVGVILPWIRIALDADEGLFTTSGIESDCLRFTARAERW